MILKGRYAVSGMASGIAVAFIRVDQLKDDEIAVTILLLVSHQMFVSIYPQRSTEI